MKKHYTIKVWPKDPRGQALEINKYASVEDARADVPNVAELIGDNKWMIAVRFGEAKTLADNYRNMRKAMKGA